MSPIGKLFLVLNLVLAGAFVGSAANLIGTSDEWRAKASSTESQLAEAKAEADAQINALNSQIQTIQGERDRLKNDVAQVQGQLAAVEQDLLTEQQQNGDLRESLTSIEAKLSNLEGTNRTQASQITELQRKSDTLRDERDAALDDRDQAVAAATRAGEAQQLAVGRTGDLESALRSSRDTAESAQAQLLAAARMYGFDPNVVAGAPPLLDGVVLEASYDGGAPIVMINLGKKHNVKPGFTFDVFNGAAYKGQIRIEVVNDATSAATISLPSNTRVARGDRVSTHM